MNGQQTQAKLVVLALITFFTADAALVMVVVDTMIHQVKPIHQAQWTSIDWSTLCHRSTTVPCAIVCCSIN